MDDIQSKIARMRGLIATIKEADTAYFRDDHLIVDDLVRFAGGRDVVMSWKLDGLTLVLRYDNGELQQAITREREGIIGEDVTHTVRTRHK